VVDLVWHDFYAMGVESIDAEHKQILSIMQDAQAAIFRGDLDQCAILLHDLMLAAEEHFKHEESYLREARFPGLDEHSLYHREMLVKAEHVKSVCEGLEVGHDVQACFDGLVRFLIDDILAGDMKFKSYLQHHGYTQS